MQNDVLDHCVQLHGGYGFMNEYRVARAWRDARVTKIWAGSNEIMKELIGRDLGCSERRPRPQVAGSPSSPIGAALPGLRAVCRERTMDA